MGINRILDVMAAAGTRPMLESAFANDPALRRAAPKGPTMSPQRFGRETYAYVRGRIAQRRLGLGSLGVTPATDTAPPTQLNAPISIGVILTVAVALGGLIYLTEKNDGKGEP